MSLVIEPGVVGDLCAAKRKLCLQAGALLIASVTFGHSQSGGIFSLGISDDARVRFTWKPNAEPNLAGYKLYVGTVSGVYAGFVDVGRATTVELPDLLRGMTYYFALTAYNTAGTESDLTPELTYHVPLFVDNVLPANTTEVSAITALPDSEAPLNSPPAISAIPDQSLLKNRASDPIPFAVSDVETSAASLQLTAHSSNPLVVLSSGLTLAGSDADRTLVIDPVNGQTGASLVTLTVTDGSSITTMSFLVTVEPHSD